MELFHIHTLGTYDNLYVPNNIIDVDNTYNNSLYYSIFNLNMTLTNRQLPKLFEAISKDLQSMSVEKKVEKSRVFELMQYMQFFGWNEPEECNKFFEYASKIVKRYHMAMNEVAYEQSRQLYSPNSPSRLHSMFGCDEKAINNWATKMEVKRADVFKVEVTEEPLLTNPSFLPPDDIELFHKVTEARKYFSPLNVTESTSNEYLFKGKVLLKEKVQEIRRK